jgi:hypothetical protein
MGQPERVFLHESNRWSNKLFEPPQLTVLAKKFDAFNRAHPQKRIQDSYIHIRRRYVPTNAVGTGEVEYQRSKMLMPSLSHETAFEGIVGQAKVQALQRSCDADDSHDKSNLGAMIDERVGRERRR